jgi:hypothetical protein
MMTIGEAINKAEEVLPGTPVVGDGVDPRWQAIIDVGEFVETNPNEVWDFVVRWGSHTCEDLRASIATCLLEHLLEYHFKLIFPRVKKAAKQNRLFADMFCGCSKFGQSQSLINSMRFSRLKRRYGGVSMGRYF